MTTSDHTTSQGSSDTPEQKTDYVANRQLVESLADILLDQYPSTLIAPRRLSLRAQFPICGLDGKAGDTGMLWPFMKGDGFEPYREANGMQSALHGEYFSYSVTAGRGVMEIQIHPCENLHEQCGTP